jgi:hypothetical protein
MLAHASRLIIIEVINGAIGTLVIALFLQTAALR